MYNTFEIASIIDAEVKDLKRRKIDWLLTDSRSLCYPESTVFFAIKTERGNGHLYIADLYQRGVRAFVVSETPQGNFPLQHSYHRYYGQQWQNAGQGMALPTLGSRFHCYSQSPQLQLTNRCTSLRLGTLGEDRSGSFRGGYFPKERNGVSGAHHQTHNRHLYLSG